MGIYMTGEVELSCLVGSKSSENALECAWRECLELWVPLLWVDLLLDLDSGTWTGEEPGRIGRSGPRALEPGGQ